MSFVSGIVGPGVSRDVINTSLHLFALLSSAWLSCLSPLRWWEGVRQELQGTSARLSLPKRDRVSFLLVSETSLGCWTDVGPLCRPNATYPSQEQGWVLLLPWKPGGQVGWCFPRGRAQCRSHRVGEVTVGRRKSPLKR